MYKLSKTIQEVVITKQAFKEVLTDYVFEFKDEAIQRFTGQYGITHAFVFPYHYQITAIEKIIRALMSKLRKLSEFGNIIGQTL